jgi:hypothetical protein
MQTYNFCDTDFKPIQTSLFHLNLGCKWDIMSWTHPLDDLPGVYSRIFLESFWKIFKIIHHIIMLWFT